MQENTLDNYYIFNLEDDTPKNKILKHILKHNLNNHIGYRYVKNIRLNLCDPLNLDIKRTIDKLTTQALGNITEVHYCGCLEAHIDETFKEHVPKWRFCTYAWHKDFVFVHNGFENPIIVEPTGDIIEFDHFEFHAFIPRALINELFLDDEAKVEENYQKYIKKIGTNLPNDGSLMADVEYQETIKIIFEFFFDEEEDDCA